MLVGAALVFFLGTKQGRKIFRNLSENALELLGNLTDDDKVDLDDDKGSFEEENLEETGEKPQNGHGKLTKRFFKGIKKKP